AQPLFNRDREASLRIENKELLSASGNGYFRSTSCGIVFSSTQKRAGLRSGAVQGESAQAVRASRKETLRERNVTPSERRNQAQTNVVGPNQPGPNLFVVGSLAEKARDIVSRAKHFRA